MFIASMGKYSAVQLFSHTKHFSPPLLSPFPQRRSTFCHACWDNPSSQRIGRGSASSSDSCIDSFNMAAESITVSSTYAKKARDFHSPAVSISPMLQPWAARHPSPCCNQVRMQQALKPYTLVLTRCGPHQHVGKANLIC